MEPETIQKNGASPKSQMNRKNNNKAKIKFLCLFSIVALGLLTWSCKDEDEKTSAESFLENPYVNSAIGESGIPVYPGDNPPTLAGTYSTSGSYTAASDELSDIIGETVSSTVVLYNQTASGKIDLEERADGMKVSGSGGYITGDNGRFTIYVESKQSGSEAGLPDNVTATVLLMMSGTQSSTGNLTGVQGITVVTDINKSGYEELKKGWWWKWNATFTLSKTKSSSVETTESGINRIALQKLLQQIATNK
jgi:hypothetical protein